MHVFFLWHGLVCLGLALLRARDGEDDEVGDEVSMGDFVEDWHGGILLDIAKRDNL